MKKLIVAVVAVLAVSVASFADNQYFSGLASTGTYISGTQNIQLVILTNGSTTAVLVDIVATGLASNTAVRTIACPANTTTETHLNGKKVTNCSVKVSTATSGLSVAPQLSADVEYR